MQQTYTDQSARKKKPKNKIAIHMITFELVYILHKLFWRFLDPPQKARERGYCPYKIWRNERVTLSPQNSLVWKMTNVTKLYEIEIGMLLFSKIHQIELGVVCIESKNWQHFHFNKFLRPSTLFLCDKIIC